MSQGFKKVVELILKYGGSSAMLQRKLKISYSRAEGIMDTLQSKGVVGKKNGYNPRTVLITHIDDIEK